MISDLHYGTVMNVEKLQKACKDYTIRTGSKSEYLIIDIVKQ